MQYITVGKTSLLLKWFNGQLPSRDAEAVNYIPKIMGAMMGVGGAL